MRLQLIAVAIPVLSLLACGSDSGQTYTLSSGTYVLSNTSAVAPDDCNLGPAFPDGTDIQIVVAGSNVTFVFGAVNATRNPVVSLQGNTFGSGSKTYDFDNNTNPTGQDFDCVETDTVNVAGGSLLADDQLSATVLLTAVQKSGTACTPANLGYKTFPCSSTITFDAKKP
jgi:hypothetical protein